MDRPSNFRDISHKVENLHFVGYHSYHRRIFTCPRGVGTQKSKIERHSDAKYADHIVDS